MTQRWLNSRTTLLEHVKALCDIELYLEKVKVSSI